MIKSTIEKIKQWIVNHKGDIILLIGVILISLLSFALGFILAKQQEKEPLRIEYYEKSSKPLSYCSRWQ